MRYRILTLFTLMTLCSFHLTANAATYNWYFSNNATGNAAGNDTNGDGSKGKPWKTLSKAQSAIDALSSGDIANLFFDRGDTWSANTEALSGAKNIFHVDSANPTVYINAYGSGNRPIFDGLVTDFSAVAYDNCPGAPCRYSRFFEFSKRNSSILNVEIKGVYGKVIYLGLGTNDADGFTLSNSYIHDFGSDAVALRSQVGVQDAVIEYNTIHTGQELYRAGKKTGWGAGINLECGALPNNNTVRYNLVYDIYGEGINAPNSTIEYNVIGDTGSIGANVSVHSFDALTAVVRYNLIVMSDWSSSIYDNMKGSDSTGIRIYDEKSGGDNSGADISVYGNVIINRSRGIRFYCYDGGDTECGQVFGSVKIYNNMIIDSHKVNISILSPSNITNFYFYNNSSILYSRTSADHAFSITPGAGWDIDTNHFWTKGGSPNVPKAWQSNHVTTNPKLPGEPALDWDGLTGANYFHMIDFVNHLYISPDSGLANAGKILDSGYNSMFLTAGTDFSKFKFQKISQPDSAKWCIGAILPENISGKPKPECPNQPNGFKVVKK